MSDKKTKPETKKRTRLADISALQKPGGFNDPKYAGRWVSRKNLDLRSDGFEPRGYKPWVDEATGKTVSIGDLTWCYKTKEEADFDTQDRHEAASDKIRAMLIKQQAEDDKLTHAAGKAGAKVSFTYESE